MKDEAVVNLNAAIANLNARLTVMGTRVEQIEHGPRRPDGYIDSINKLIQRNDVLACRVADLEKIAEQRWAETVRRLTCIESETRWLTRPSAPYSLPFHITPTYENAMDNAWSLVRTQQGGETTWCTDLPLPTACRLRDMLNKEFSA